MVAPIITCQTFKAAHIFAKVSRLSPFSMQSVSNRFVHQYRAGPCPSPVCRHIQQSPEKQIFKNAGYAPFKASLSEKVENENSFKFCSHVISNKAGCLKVIHILGVARMGLQGLLKLCALASAHRYDVWREVIAPTIHPGAAALYPMPVTNQSQGHSH